ncbi:MAG: flagellar motor protein MotB [Acidobacteriota bacterium]
MAEHNEEAPKPRRRVKKVKGHGGHHGGAWKVAYADLVTALMALFLVLWLVSQADTKLKESIANHFRSPGVFSTVKGGILNQAKKVSKEPTALTSKDDEQMLFSVAQTLRKKFASKPEFTKYEDQIKIDVTDEGLKIELIDKADKVSFQSGSADLTEEAKSILTEIASGLCELPNKINIGGHTDSRVFPSDNGYTNWELSADRANAARRVLESTCVRPSQINRIVGYADTELLVPDDRFSPANRRISIMVLRMTETGETSSDNSNNQSEAEENSPNKPEIKSEKTPEAKPKVKLKTAESPTEKEEKEKSENSSEKGKGDSETQSEKQTIKNKLQKEGAVTIGEPDQVPNKPKVKIN